MSGGQRMRSILNSFQRLPLWVRLWMVLWLMPVNIATLVFICIAALLGNGNLHGMAGFVIALVITNVISLVFDYPDVIRWTKGNRKIA